MSELRDLLDRRASGYGPPPDLLERVLDRRRRRDRNRRVGAALVALAVVAVGIGGLFRAFSSRPVPADDELGIFAPVDGRIVFVNQGSDLGYDPGIWAVDPGGLSDTTEGPGVAEDVVSSLVPLDLEDATPLGWSGDGTELLFKRSVETPTLPEEYLCILHADGSVTQLNSDPMYFAGATIAPDGSRVVFATQGARSGLFAIDREGGRPAPLPYASPGDVVSHPTFSPDGTKIAYHASGGVWVADADGTDAREILTNEELVIGGVSGLQWSPRGDRLALGAGMADGGEPPTIYTFKPDGSGLREIMVGGIAPFWSPDGSQIAYTIPSQPDSGRYTGLAIAWAAHGIIARVFGFAASGPWQSQVDYGWPTMGGNSPGVYSWDGSRCGSPSPRDGSAPSCALGPDGGWMHGPAGVEILLRVEPEGNTTDDAAVAVTVAGNEGIYRRIDPRLEEWVVDIEGTTVRIQLKARPGTSQADLAEAHAIVDSMRWEPWENDVGFRLIFTLTTDAWDSG